MEILITGASGFIARYVASELSRKGYQLLLQSRASKYIPLCGEYKWICKSFLNICPDDLPSVSAIIHLASAGVSPQIVCWEDLQLVNIVGTLKMCQLANSLGIPIIIAGSSSEYGRSGLHYDQIPVDAPLCPTDPYAISKALSASLAINFARHEGIQLAYLRIFNAYGIGQFKKNLWPSLIDAALAGRDFNMTAGEQIRDFIPVQDVAEKFVEVLEKSKFKRGSPYLINIASGQPQKIKTFCQNEWVKYSTGGRLNVGIVPYRPSEVMRYVPSMVSKYV